MSNSKPSTPLYGRISSDIVTLNTLSEIYPWIPNEHTIRPSPTTLARKHIELPEMEHTWMTIRDCIYHDVYGLPYKICPVTGKQYVDGTPSAHEAWAFRPSRFPYDLPAGANHWILWNSEGTFDDEYDDATVNAAIVFALDSHLEHGEFQYAWYKNPKPTVPHVWHVQVFWKNTRSAA